MKQDEACKYKMPFGKHQGKTLEDITLIEKDVGYLDWMAGNKLTGDVKEALDCFLAIHWVKDLVERAVEQHRGRTGSTEPVENIKKPKNWWEK